jgi:hydrogenase-4 component B
MLLLIPVDYTAAGYLLLAVSLLSGLYGVMLAIVQHNLKKLLAYHSIENIGIIGMGIGLGCIGLGNGNTLLASLGFAGALLHTLNHSLFKSLLFFTAGNVYKATHTLHIEHLGGVMKKMPQTAILFLIAAIAICGIPPFNGFISEFLIYTGLYTWMQHASLVSLVAIIFTILGLVLIGGLAIFCFTKAFGIVFLGNPRQEFQHPVKEVSFPQLAPLYLITFFIVAIGIFPQFFISFLARPVALFTNTPEVAALPVFENISGIMQPIAWCAWGLIGVTMVLWWLRRSVVSVSQSTQRTRSEIINEIKSPISNIQQPISRDKSEIVQLVPYTKCRDPKSEIVYPKSEITDLSHLVLWLHSPHS